MGDGTTLILEDAPEIEIYLHQREDGWANIAPSLATASGPLLPLGTMDPPKRSPVEMLDVYGFRNARFRDQPRATRRFRQKPPVVRSAGLAALRSLPRPT